MAIVSYSCAGAGTILVFGATRGVVSGECFHLGGYDRQVCIVFVDSLVLGTLFTTVEEGGGGKKERRRE